MCLSLLVRLAIKNSKPLRPVSKSGEDLPLEEKDHVSKYLNKQIIRKSTGPDVVQA